MEEKSEYIKDSFYDQLETAVTGCPRSNIKIPLGGLNAKIWFEDQDRSSDGNCGSIGLASAPHSRTRRCI
jgi:hypothetical protein